jgi:LPXTG-motif cell wall-anchored protein
MTNTLIQYGLWLVAGGLLLVFLKRRRSRKEQN